MSTQEQAGASIADWEREEIEAANANGGQPVIFIHGLWLLGSSWDNWAEVFRGAGYATLQPGWPDDPSDVEEAKANPEVFANKKVGQVADHYAAIAGALGKKPALVGHSFGGLLVQILAGRGLSAATVAVDPAPFRGVLPLPFSALKASSTVLKNPANRHRAIPLRSSSSATASRTRSARTRRRRCTRSTRSPARARRSSRRRRRTSTRTPTRKWRSRTPTAARC